MKNFEYNWATAEMVKMYLRNSRAQEARRARTTTDTSADTQEVPTINVGLVTANSGAGTGHSNLSDSESSDSDSDSPDEDASS